jgi:hypothetical protein
MGSSASKQAGGLWSLVLGLPVSGGVAVFVDESAAACASQDRSVGVDRDDVRVARCALIAPVVGG